MKGGRCADVLFTAYQSADFMSIWVIIPVKPFNRAKSRLSEVLSPQQRQSLAENMLRHVLQVVASVPQVMGTLVVSRDTKALALARDFGARTVQESGTPELNQALMRATQIVIGWKGDAVLILPADLPLLAASDIVGLIELGRAQRTVVIATDQDEDGTNALLLRPPGLINYAYGVGSYHRHIDLARAAGAAVQFYRSLRLSQDIDVPEDLRAINQLAEYNLLPNPVSEM
jgi:2-phospho-L-lactate/phosphoenolpyruvate guanylyltransferase